MKIFIGLVTPDEALRRSYGAGKERVVPTDSISRGYYGTRQPSIALGTYAPECAPSADDLEKLLLSKTRTNDTCLLLIDGEWEHFAVNVRNASFSVVFNRNAISNLQNFFQQMIAKLLRAFSSVASKLDNCDDTQLLALPLRNFHAGELAEIARLCREDGLAPTFSNDLQQQLRILNKRRRPRRRTTFNTKYIVDDKIRFFEYGHELHSRVATGAPHRPYCELTGQFRFGKRINALRHYNVSETEGDDTTIQGEFLDCHNDCHVVKARTHINMFSNDYF
jgi:hypothetical protein